MIKKEKIRGFTLIELVVVLVILGILAAVAVPRYLDLSYNAQKESIVATASAIESGASINYAKHKVNPTSPDAYGFSTATYCTDAFQVLLSNYNPNQPAFATISDTIEPVQNDPGLGFCQITDWANTVNGDPMNTIDPSLVQKAYIQLSS